MARPPTPPSYRFWPKVRITDGCWNWQASITQDGYGKFAIRKSQIIHAHRASWLLSVGPIPEGAFVLHHCDNPPCVRPDHLYIGDAADNWRDTLLRTGRPSNRPRFTDVEALRIRAAYVAGEQKKVLAARLGVSSQTVHNIIHGLKTYRHLPTTKRPRHARVRQYL